MTQITPSLWRLTLPVGVLRAGPVQVALAMMKEGKAVNVGDHIPYVICEKEGAKSAADRSYHPDEVLRSDGALKVRTGLGSGHAA
jgi:DNA polymerase elongation subunit (family B)